MASPMMPPPVSNPNDDEGPRILGATLTVTLLALVTFSMRAYVRGFMIHNFGWDDWIMALAMAISVSGQCLIIPEVRYGAGRHMGDLHNPDDIRMGMMLNFITQPLYLINICVVKLAVGASLLRIASHPFYKKIIIGVMGFMSFYTIGCFFTVMFQCTDIRVQWDSSIQATCWTANTLKSLSYTNVSLTIITDLLFAVFIPAPMLWNLNVNRRTRYTLMAILGLGVFACAAAMIKSSFIGSYGAQGDWLWDSRNITIWTVVENNVGIVAGCLPCLRPLFRGTFLGSSYGKGSRVGASRNKSGLGYPSTNTSKSGPSRWKGSKILDEEASERGFAPGRDEFELSSHRAEVQVSRGGSTGVGHHGDKSSQDSLDRFMELEKRKAGITKTTSVALEFSKD